MKFPSFGLRARLFTLVLLAIIPACGLILYSAWQQRQDARDNVQDQTLHLAQLGVVQQQQVIEGSRQLLGTIASLASGSDLSTITQEQCGPLFAGLLNDFSFYSNLGIVTSSGDVVCSAVPPAQAATDSDRPWFQRAVETRKLSVGDYEVDQVTGKPTITIAEPILSQAGEFKGLMFVGLDLTWLNQQLAAAEIPDGANFTIVDRNGVVVARSPDPARWTGQTIPDETMAAIRSGSGVSEIAGVDGVKRLSAITPITGASDSGLHAIVGIPLGTAYSRVNAELTRNLIALGVVAVLALSAAWIGSEMFVLRQTRALVAATKRLANGDFSARSGLGDGGGELHALASHFDEMGSELERHNDERAQAAEQLRAINESLEERIRERTASVARQAEELARSNTELQDFAYVISHDLKEPLRAIEAFSGFLSKGYNEKLDEDGQKYVRLLRESAVRMKDLIEDVLRLSRVGRGKRERATVAVQSIVEEVRTELDFSLKERKVDLRVQPQLPVISCDPVHMKQLFANLISNAIKYNDKPQPIVEVLSRSEDGFHTFSVRDNGPGIEKRYQEKIFRIFQRLVRREDYEGTGVGLAICKKVVELEGGNIWVESTPGEGSTFLFTIPKQPDLVEVEKEEVHA
jgi:signal transduction histidine kinase